MRGYILFLILLTGTRASAQSTVTPAAYTVPGNLYNQNFDGLPNSGTFALTGKGPFNLANNPISGAGLTGWQLLMSAGTNANAGFAMGTGSSTGNGVYSLGAAGSVERALGSLSSSTGIYAFGMVFINQTGGILNSFTLSFTAEQWRKGGSGNKNTWAFHYKTGPISHIDQTGLQDEPNLNFSSINTTTTAASLNGNLPENRQTISYTVNGITWKPGEQLLLRWDDADETGSDDMVAIDNLSFSATLVSGPPIILSSAVTNIGTTTANWNGSVNDNYALTAILLEYDTSGSFSSPQVIHPSPDTLQSGSGNTNMSVTLTGLSSGTTYYLRVKGSNTKGAATGSIHNFATQIALPTVTTKIVSAVSTSTAVLGGGITDSAGGSILEKGIVWSLSGIPSLSNNKIAMGNGIGSFSAPVTGLPQGTTIYARAYAINIGGVAYGDTIRFATHTTILSLNTTATGSTNAITVTFSFKTAQNISGLTTANFAVVSTGITDASVTAIAGASNSFTVTVHTGTGNGTLGLNFINDAGLSLPVNNKPFPSAGYYTIDKTAPQINAINIPDKTMKVGDTIPVVIMVKPDADNYKMNTGNINGFTITEFNKKNDSAYQCSFIILNGGNDVASLADIPASISLADQAGNVGVYNLPIRQSSDQIDANKPFVLSIKNPANGIYRAGDTLYFTCRFSEKIFVSGGNPSLSLTVGTGTRTAQYLAGSSSDSLLFRYIISSGSFDNDGIKTAGTITLNNAVIKDSAGNTATVSFNNTLATKDILIDAVIPVINSITVPASSVYKTGNILDFIVGYTKKIFLSNNTCLPSLVIGIGNALRNATFVNGSGSNTLLFRYSIQPGDVDTDGIQLLSIQDSVFTIRDSVGNRASMVLNNTGTMAAIQVNPPTILFDKMIIPPNDTYRMGDTLEFFVVYNEPVLVTTNNGVPSLKLTIGSVTKQAMYTMGSGTSTICFAYTIEAGDEDTDGVRINTSITLNNSTIKDASGNNAPLVINNAASSNGIWIDATAPVILSIRIPPGGTYKTGDTLGFVVSFTESVILSIQTDPPVIKMTIGSEEKNIVYTKGSGSNELMFLYVIQAGDIDKNGISIASTIVLNNAILTDKAGNKAVLNFKTVSASAIKIDAVAPVITSIKSSTAGVYTTGDLIEFTASYSKKVFVASPGQVPFLSFSIGDKIKNAAYTNGSGTNNLLFSYTIQAEDIDLTGIRLISPMNDAYLNIKDSVGNTASATFTAHGTTTGIQVNPPVIFIEVLSIPGKSTYKTGDTLNFYARYNNKVFVTTSTGAPTLKITIGSAIKQAVFIKDTGNNTLYFRYIVQTGDEETEGIKINSSLTLNNATIKGELGNNAMIVLPSIDTKDIRVDAVSPVINNVQVPHDGVYKAGDTLNIVLHFSEPVKLQIKKDTSSIKITIGSTVRNMWHMEGNVSYDLRFMYIVQFGDLDKNGISLGSSIFLNNNMLTDIVGNNAIPNFKINASLSNIIIDAVSPVFTQAKTDTVQLCANSSAVTISNVFAVTDEESGELISWKIKNKTKQGSLSILTYSANSNGKNIIPAGIQYTPYPGHFGIDSIVTEITDGVNTSEKTIILLLLPPLQNNTIGFSQTVCAEQTISTLTGTEPAGGNGAYKYAWEISSDSLQFTIAKGNHEEANYSPSSLNNHAWFRRRILSGVCNDTSSPIKITVLKNSLWTGSNNNDWHNTKNWCGNLLPTDSTNVRIYANTLYEPFISDTARCNQLTIYPGAHLTITGILALTGNIYGSDNSIRATKAGILFNGSAQQIISGKIFENRYVQDMIINNTSGVALLDELVLGGTLSLTKGFLQTNDHLLLTQHASIGASADGSSVRGKVSVEHLLKGGRRVFHLLGNPFADDMNLQMIKDSLDITGDNGSLNGFTTTVTNQPSAFRYDSVMGNDSSGFEAGWVPFTNTNSSADNTWKKYSGIRLLMRGKPGQGLDGIPAGDGKNGTYLPAPVTLKLSGNINTGDQEMILQKDLYAAYHIVANPYIANIDLSRITHGNDIGNYYWVWNPFQGKQGGYTSFPFRNKNILPPLGVFIIRSNGNNDNRLLFTEQIKSTEKFSDSIPPIQIDDIFYVELRLESDSIFWDRIILMQMDSAKTGFDKNDAEKFLNNDVNFYSLSREQKTLSIDARPLNNNSVIPLGMQTNQPGAFGIRVAKQKLYTPSSLMLHDKYLGNWMELSQDSVYHFTTTNDTSSFGNNRFEISSRKKTADTLPARPVIIVKISPVPAKDKIVVLFSSPEKGNTSIRLLSLSGKLLKTIQLGLQQDGQFTIPISDLLSGIYLLEIRCGDKSSTKKIIKD
ncbi:MAG: T9SS type A sorting domain-containing protein [Bacteroidota bacterium]